jgi:hypothetical protein
VNTWQRVQAVAFLMGCLAVPATVSADETTNSRLCGEWGVRVWGLTYHVDRGTDYNNLNWGGGVRCYARPAWTWLGRASENKVFVEADALRNSYRGLLVPVSAGVEYKVGTVGTCKALFVGAVTVGYYGDAVRRRASIRGGPLPGFALGCGRFKPSVTIIPTRSQKILTALAVSTTIMF